MNAYYRARDGQRDGPYFEGQLIAMRDAGDLGDQDWLCLQGAEEWLPALLVLEGVVEDPVAASRPPEKNKIGRRLRRWGDVWVLGVWLAGALALPAIGRWFDIPVQLLQGVAFLGLVLLGTRATLGRFVCSACGNSVERRSRQCPVCGAGFIPARLSASRIRR